MMAFHHLYVATKRDHNYDALSGKKFIFVTSSLSLPLRDLDDVPPYFDSARIFSVCAVASETLYCLT